ncbi:MAG: hypothetical protein PHZ03_06355 [Syntrophomonas sp.]|nr:hypothetical protein [Syntrophomonas sp.]
MRQSRKDKTGFTRFLSVSVLFATKKHRFPKKLSTPAVFLPNHFFYRLLPLFFSLYPSFLEPLYNPLKRLFVKGLRLLPSLSIFSISFNRLSIAGSLSKSLSSLSPSR